MTSTTTVYIGNIPGCYCNETILEKIMSKYGTVQRCTVLNRSTSTKYAATHMASGANGSANRATNFSNSSSQRVNQPQQQHERYYNSNNRNHVNNGRVDNNGGNNRNHYNRTNNNSNNNNNSNSNNNQQNHGGGANGGYDKNGTSSSVGFAFCQFETIEGANAAIANVHGRLFRGNKLVVRYAINSQSDNTNNVTSNNTNNIDKYHCAESLTKPALATTSIGGNARATSPCEQGEQDAEMKKRNSTSLTTTSDDLNASSNNTNNDKSCKESATTISARHYCASNSHTTKTAATERYKIQNKIQQIKEKLSAKQRR